MFGVPLIETPSEFRTNVRFNYIVSTKMDYIRNGMVLHS